MDDPDQARRKQRDQRGLSQCILLALALVGIAATTFINLTGAASAQSLLLLPATAGPIQPVERAVPIGAWIKFCQKQPQECQIDHSQPAQFPLTPGVWAMLIRVNEHVNSVILAVTDQDHWGVVDRWDYPDDGMGDCEDIQLLKRKLLVEAGLPQRALRMTVVIDEEGQGHAVLMARTDRGDFILDNKRDAILPWRKTGYIFIKREGADGPAWVALGDQPASVVTANR
jgi:predicted transglutaminase-like cysteine proteinase